mmetsp:Transcript_25347/g.84694  ORF Transcript_25347/g.84694 Transcript_25347/m.84694 type:complete len:264 (+) Transcript_25347:257-1048(+)
MESISKPGLSPRLAANDPALTSTMYTGGGPEESRMPRGPSSNISTWWTSKPPCPPVAFVSAAETEHANAAAGAAKDVAEVPALGERGCACTGRGQATPGATGNPGRGCASCGGRCCGGRCCTGCDGHCCASGTAPGGCGCGDCCCGCGGCSGCCPGTRGGGGRALRGRGTRIGGRSGCTRGDETTSLGDCCAGGDGDGDGVGDGGGPEGGGPEGGLGRVRSATEASDSTSAPREETRRHLMGCPGSPGTIQPVTGGGKFFLSA